MRTRGSIGSIGNTRLLYNGLVGRILALGIGRSLDACNVPIRLLSTHAGNDDQLGSGSAVGYVYFDRREPRYVQLEGLSAIVTGAANGIGREMAGGFVREGADVTCVDVESTTLSESIDRFDGPGHAEPVTADVRSWDDVLAMVGRARRVHGPIDVLVNNAGVKQLTLTGDERPAWEVPVRTWDTVVDTNLRGPFLCTRAVVPAMVDRGAGRVIFVTSGHGTKARERRAPYVSSKFGLEGFARTLALDLDGTGVASVSFTPPPGGVRTREAAFVADPGSMRHEPDVVVEPAIRLAAGEGENGGRYRGTADGDGFLQTHSTFDRSTGQ